MGSDVAEFGAGYMVPASVYIKIILFLVVAFIGCYLVLWFLKRRGVVSVPGNTVVTESVQNLGHGVSVMILSVEGSRFALFKSKDHFFVERLEKTRENVSPEISHLSQ